MARGSTRGFRGRGARPKGLGIAYALGTSMNLRGDPDSASGEAAGAAGAAGAPLVERRSAGIEALVHGVGPDAMAAVLAMARPRRHLVRGEALYVAGSPASAVYFVHAGTVKSLVGLQDGRRQAVGYHIMGDVVGLPGLATGTHPDDAVACEDAEIAALDYAELARLARAHPRLHANLTRLLAVATSGGRDAMLRLRSGKASARLAAFLIALERRLAQRGVPAGSLPLALNNHEIASLIGLTGETVSRCLNAFIREGLIARGPGSVALIDRGGLQQLAAAALGVEAVPGTMAPGERPRDDD